ncbi:hypothetical protein [Ectobacillus polymachus]|uniref:COG4315 family predicted lipoprotein n=1 Tax=Ectobacillus polymachus TaxID=1508806 RepID=UPI003A894C1E
MKKWMFLLSILLIVNLAACSSNKENAQSASASKETASEVTKNTDTSSLQLLQNEKVGEYLADSKGLTLYYFKNDKSGLSTCKDECLKTWPPFNATDFKVPQGFNKEDFNTITRADTGQAQVTYKGYPLYYFVNDKSKGDVNGQGVKNVWYIVNVKTTFNQ